MLQQVPALFLSVVLISSLLAGCGSMKADPSRGAGFVPTERMAKQGDLPFNKAWIKAGLDWRRYHSIYIRPVDTGYLLQTDLWKQTFRRGHMKEDARMLARYMEDRFRTAFLTSRSNHLRVVESPRPGSLVLEMAITELVPSHVVMEALGYAPYGGGVAAKAISRATGGVCTVAFEAKVRDSHTGKVVAMFADREQQKFKPVDLQAFTWYGNARNIVDEWADQFVLVLNKRPGQVVEASSPFSLKPW